MPKEPQQHLFRTLMHLGATQRLKDPPEFNYWRIGKGRRATHHAIEDLNLVFQRRVMEGEVLSAADQRAALVVAGMLNDPGINAYTAAFRRKDEQIVAIRPLFVPFTIQPTAFILEDPASTSALIIQHFHPIRWPAFEACRDWELMREAIPAMQIARIQLRVYEEQRWLIDERSQQIAEVLAYRIQHVYRTKRLPKHLQIDAQQHALFEGYAERLERGVDARRWFQAQLQTLTGKRRSRRRSAAQKLP